MAELVVPLKSDYFVRAHILEGMFFLYVGREPDGSIGKVRMQGFLEGGRAGTLAILLQDVADQTDAGRSWGKRDR